MVAINSTSYPCLAVIQHFMVPPEDVYRMGRLLFEMHVHGRRIYATDIPQSLVADKGAYERLWANYFFAAEKFGWR